MSESKPCPALKKLYHLTNSEYGQEHLMAPTLQNECQRCVIRTPSPESEEGEEPKEEQHCPKCDAPLDGRYCWNCMEWKLREGEAKPTADVGEEKKNIKKCQCQKCKLDGNCSFQALAKTSECLADYDKEEE